jgi:hypothetical protein
LSARQLRHLDQWGYPYVFDEFRFHMTLTGTLSEPDRKEALAVLRELYSEADAPVALDSVCILHQPDRFACFTVLERFFLRNA